MLAAHIRAINVSECGELAHFRSFCREFAVGTNVEPLTVTAYYVISGLVQTGVYKPKSSTRFFSDSQIKKLEIFCTKDLGVVDRDKIQELAKRLQARLKAYVLNISIESNHEDDHRRLVITLHSHVTMEQLARYCEKLVCGTDAYKKTAMCLSYSKTLIPEPYRVHWTMAFAIAKDFLPLYDLWKVKNPLPLGNVPVKLEVDPRTGKICTRFSK